MRIDAPLKRYTKQLVRNLLGSAGYANLLALRYRYLSARAKGHAVRFSPEGNLIRASDGADGFYFTVPERAARYIWNDGPLRMSEEIWRKYVHRSLSIEQGAVAIDIGANVGEFAVAAARRGLSVHAFEPDPHAWLALSANLDNYATSHALQVGLGDVRCERTFYLATGTADSSLVRPRRFEREMTITIIPLDQYVREQRIKEISVLKIEAEGFEPEVLAGCEEALKMTRYVTIDCGPERLGMDTVSECSSVLRAAGFSLTRAGWILKGVRD